MKIVWSEPARQDVRQIFEFIATENPNAARRLLDEIRKQANILVDNPQIGRSGRVEGTRELVLAGTHHILPYRIKDKQVQIVAVFHTSRQQWPESF